MAVSISHLGYRKLSRMIFEWQAADRTSLLALFILMEAALHWLWCLFVWWRQDIYGAYVDMTLLYPLWIGVTLMGVFSFWMNGRFSPIKKNNNALYKWQATLVTLYSIYIAVVILVMGHSGLVSGVSLVGGAMLAMMLIRRRYVWRAFLGHAAVILAVTLIPYFGVVLPNLRQITSNSFPLSAYSYLTYGEITALDNALPASVLKNNLLSWDALNQLRVSSVFFWHSTHIYMALPKAFFIVYMFRALLSILDDSKKEILQHANQDELTQLNSRRYGLRQMNQALASIKDQQDFSVMLLDLDWFKDVNDNYGHEVGDRVLVEVAQVLSQSLTDAAIISRYGGEEFLLVLPDIHHDKAMLIAEQLRQSIAKRVITVDDASAFNVTTSVGVYTLTYDARICITQAHQTLMQQSAESPLIKPRMLKSRSSKRDNRSASIAQLPHDICQRLIAMADKALYQAKGGGRNQVVSANKMLAEDKSIEPPCMVNSK